jgi:hypothetical protein
MRFAALPLLLLAACFGSLERDAASGDDNGSGSGSGSGMGGAFAECLVASDCAAAGPKCCDCPTHAVPKTDPSQMACANVDCPPATCGAPMEATCSENRQCELVCSPVACVEGLSCDAGFAKDPMTGCVTCDCGVATANECAMDTDCARVHADCCGCALGGKDTAVPASYVDAWNAQLMCPTNPTCPNVDTCPADLAARCVAGECTLVSGPLPPNACGRPDLPVCPQGQRCWVNANDQATMQGVGVCLPD